MPSRESLLQVQGGAHELFGENHSGVMQCFPIRFIAYFLGYRRDSTAVVEVVF